MPRTMLSDEHWSKLKPILLNLNIYDKLNLRNIFEGILYQMRTGCPWRDIPVDFGFPNTIFKTSRRWSKHNKILNIFKNLINEPDLEWVFIDVSSIAAQDVRAHQHSSGVLGLEDQAISKSAGGNSTKIHLAVDSHINPIEFIISDGTIAHDVKVAPELVDLVGGLKSD